jgi:hypothetical protein
MIIPNTKADEFMHEININSSGDTEIKIVINVTEEPITNNYLYNDMRDINKQKTTKYLSESFDFTNPFLSLSDEQSDLRSKVWNYILAKLYPYFNHVNTELATCKQYNIDNEARIFELQKRINRLEHKSQ